MPVSSLGRDDKSYPRDWRAVPKAVQRVAKSMLAVLLIVLGTYLPEGLGHIPAAATGTAWQRRRSRRKHL